MEHETGDEFIRRTASFIRTHQHGLAAAGLTRRRRPKAHSVGDGTSVFNPLGWFTPTADSSAVASAKPVVIAFDAHHLFYLLMRIEALGIDVGTLDVKVETASRPMNYVNIFPGKDRSDALSLRSFASSFTAVSRLSLGAGWWGKPPPATIDTELKYVYSSLTKLPALSIHAPEARLIAELANEPPNENALPLDSFKNLQTLVCTDIDPRTLLGWDRLAESLRSLTIKRSGLEDVGDIFIGAVLDDQARREGGPGSDRIRRIPRAPPSRQGSFHGTPLPDSVPEDAEDTPSASPVKEKYDVEDTPRPPPALAQLPSLKWAFLRHLSLADNALTFLPSAPLSSLTSLTHLDLSSNLLVSVPSGLSSLYNLVSLNLSDNMIDSVLGIYTTLGQILSLNLSRNRLESICGLERLLALERVDLRSNMIEESAEIGRLATLPNIAEVWVEGNPLVDIEEGYRIRCFDLFAKEQKSVLLDGTGPGFYEKRYMATSAPEQMTSARPVSAVYSPPAVAVGAFKSGAVGVPDAVPPAGPSGSSPKQPSPPTPSSPAYSQSASPNLIPIVGRERKKKNKRIVDLDGGSEAGSSRAGPHIRSASMTGAAAPRSRVVAAPRAGSPSKHLQPPSERENVVLSASPTDLNALPAASSNPSPTLASPISPTSARPSRHSRHQTDLPWLPPTLGKAELDGEPPSAVSPLRGSVRRSSTALSTARRARVSASVYEPSPSVAAAEDHLSEADAFRARIEALRSDMGDGWLKVFNQSHLGSPGVATG